MRKTLGKVVECSVAGGKTIGKMALVARSSVKLLWGPGVIMRNACYLCDQK